MRIEHWELSIGQIPFYVFGFWLPVFIQFDISMTSS